MSGSSDSPRRSARSPGSPRKPQKPRSSGTGVRLLAGGNPQIAKADGDAPVQAYIAAMPEDRRPIAPRLDALIVRTLPGVKKAVRWNSPQYGLDDGWFLGVHTCTRYVKVAFFRGTSLKPMPPVSSTMKQTRYVHLHVGGDFDEQQLAEWIKQSAALPRCAL